MMPNRWNVVLLFIAALVVTGCQSNLEIDRDLAGYRKTNEAEGANAVNALQISLQPDRSEWIAGTPFPVAILLENSGAQAVEAPDPKGASAFEFVFRAQDTNEEVILSAQAARLARRPDPMDPEMRTVPLAPGHQVDYAEDLGEYLVAGIAEGAYLATVRDRQKTFESSPVAVQVVPVRVAALELTQSPTSDSLALFYAHENSQGGAQFFQIESRLNRPLDGVGYPRGDVANRSALNGLAIAIELYQNQGIRWFGWLEDSGLFAGAAQKSTAFKVLGPLDLELQEPRLHPIAWQSDKNSAVFLAVGKNAEGRIVLAVSEFEYRNQMSTQAIELSNATVPEFWAATLDSESPDQRFDVVSIEIGAGQTRLGAQAVRPNFAIAEPQRVLTETEGEILAFGLNRISTPETGVVDILGGSADEDEEFAVVRLPLSGQPPLAVVPLPSFEEEDEDESSLWTVAPPILSHPVVALKRGSRILACRAIENAQWIVLSTNADRAENLRLEAIGDSMIAVWSDPEIGIRSAMLP